MILCILFTSSIQLVHIIFCHAITNTMLDTLKPAKMEHASKQKHIPENKARVNNGGGGASDKQRKEEMAGNHNGQWIYNIRNVTSSPHVMDLTRIVPPTLPTGPPKTLQSIFWYR